jgi:hypothetical protein
MKPLLKRAKPYAWELYREALDAAIRRATVPPKL